MHPRGARRSVSQARLTPRQHVDPDLDHALERIGDRWSMLVVRSLIGSPKRFNELMDELPGIAANILSSRLRQLEFHGLLVASPYSQRPLRLAYTITEPGRELARSLRSLSEWGARQANSHSMSERHDPCGSETVWQKWCPTCDIVVTAGTESDTSSVDDAANTSPDDEGLVWV